MGQTLFKEKICWLLSVVIVAACSGGATEEESAVDVKPPVAFEGAFRNPVQLARRMSIDVRGEFMDADEIALVQADVENIDVLLDGWLQEEGHRQQLVDIFSSMLLTKVDAFNVTEADFYLSEAQAYDFIRSIGEESPRLMAHIAMSDGPWTDVVQADYTMGNSILSQIWNLEPVDDVPVDVDTWVQVRYTDGRPPLGVVATNGIWWRYYTTPNNKSRARAAFLTRLLVCDDILSTAVTSPSSLQVDANNIDDFVRTDPGCLSCHQTLDPLAASLYGFWQHDMHDVVELSIYHPEREWDGERDLQLDMAWYGKSISAPAELGERIAEDERFYPCAVSSLAERLWRRPVLDIDEGRIETIAHQVSQHSARYRDIFKAILNSPEYQILIPADPTDVRSAATAKMMTAHQIQHSIKELTGFNWTDATLNLLDNDEWGYRMLLGGIDGRSTTQWLEAPSATRQLTLKRLSQLASEYVVSTAIEVDGHDLFLGSNPLDVSADEQQFIDIVTSWRLRLMGEAPDQSEIEVLQDRFQEAEVAFGRETAWTSMLSIFLRNTNTWLY